MSDAKQATPHEQLIAELMRPTVPKTEREHAAVREIERLTAELDAARRTADYWKAEHLAGNAEIERLEHDRNNLLNENERLRAELDRALYWVLMSVPSKLLPGGWADGDMRAYAEGWNDCIETMKKRIVAAAPKPEDV